MLPEVVITKSFKELVLKGPFSKLRLIQVSDSGCRPEMVKSDLVGQGHIKGQCHICLNDYSRV